MTPPYKSRGSKQCYNCQGFSHSSGNCHFEPKCIKCAPLFKCTIPKENRDKIKCINCGNNQVANWKGCPKNPINLKKKKKNLLKFLIILKIKILISSEKGILSLTSINRSPKTINWKIAPPLKSKSQFKPEDFPPPQNQAKYIRFSNLYPSHIPKFRSHS